MSPSSKRMKAIFRGLGLFAVAVVIPVLVALIQDVALADYNPRKGGSPYYYSSYSWLFPTWVWILVLPGFLAAPLFIPANNWLKNEYKQANAKLRGR